MNLFNLNFQIDKKDSKMNDRIALLLSCVDEKTLSLKMIRSHLDSLSIEKSIKDKFLHRLYMSIPHMFLNNNEVMSSNAICEEIMKDSSGSVGDKWTHTIITTIGSLTNSRDFQSLSSDTELALRKFAASHPTLLLRELSLIASLLAGRGHMDLHVLRQEHHISFFNQILGILDLLQPMIFEDIFTIGLHRALQCFFTLFQNHGRDGFLYGLIYRVTEFVRSYAAANPTGAYVLINNNSNLFAEMSAKNKGCFPLQQIVSSLQFLAKGISVPALTVKQESNQQNSIGKLGNPVKMSHEDLLCTLQEIDYQTNKKPAPLVEIFGKLNELIFNDSSDVRNLAHSLLLKMLKHNPGNSVVNSTCFNSYLQGLHSDDVNISSSVLDNLTEIVLSLQEYALEILQCVFNLGITSKINTFAPLKKCINAIKLQHD